MARLLTSGFKFIWGIQTPEQLPEFFQKAEHQLPFIVFSGKSNSGKSTLINALTNHKGLARSSKTPGRTQQINLFTGELQLKTAQIQKKKILLADLPGYGYAKVPEKLKKNWGVLISSFFEGLPENTLNFITVDGRRGLDHLDLQLIEQFQYLNLPYCVVFTKADRLKTAKEKSKTKEHIKAFTDSTGAPAFQSPTELDKIKNLIITHSFGNET